MNANERRFLCLFKNGFCNNLSRKLQEEKIRFFFIKKPRPEVERGLRQNLRPESLFARSLGCLERVDFRFGFCNDRDNMGGHVAISGFPFYRGFGAGRTKPAGRKFNRAVTTVAFFYDFTADAPCVRASFCGHKRTFHPFSDCCADHRAYLLRASL